jgi:hypothetical protein
MATSTAKGTRRELAWVWFEDRPYRVTEYLPGNVVTLLASDGSAPFQVDMAQVTFCDADYR